MIISYTNAIPDQGVDKLRDDLTSLIGNLDQNLTDKFNGLDSRVAVLEKTGTLTISEVTVRNDDRTVEVTVLTTDHLPGTTVTFNVTDSNELTVSETAVLTSSDDDRQTASTILNVSTLVEGTINVVVSSQDKYGKARNDTLIRTYSPEATAVSIDTVELDAIQRTLLVGAVFDIGYPAEDILSMAGVTLTVTNAEDPADIIINELIPSGRQSGTSILTWEDVLLDTTAARLDILVKATDAYGEPVSALRSNLDSSALADSGIIINSATSDGREYTSTVKAYLWNAETAVVTISNSGGTVTKQITDATVSTTVPDNTDTVDYTGAKLYTWTIDSSSLAPEAIELTVTMTDSYTRTASEDTTIAYAPLGKVTNIANTINSAGKTINMSFTSEYVSIGSVVTLQLSSSVNGYSEVHELTMTDTGFTFSAIDVSSFPFGVIVQTLTVTDQIGNTAAWDSSVTLSDVQGDITLHISSNIDSYGDIAGISWQQTGVVTVDRVMATDSAGKVVEVTTVTTTPSGDVYTEFVDISTLKYGYVTLRIEGRDGANRPLSDTVVINYENKEGVVTLTSITFNPTTRIARVQGNYANLKQGALLQLVHWDQTDAAGKTTDNLLTIPDNGTAVFDKTFSYPYPDRTNISHQFKSIDAKEVSFLSVPVSANVGEQGSISLTASINSVTGTLSLSGSVNGSVPTGARVDISVGGASTLSSNTTVATNRSFSKSLALPSGNYGTYNITVTVTDQYGKDVSRSFSTSYTAVNGSISISSVGTATAGSTVTVSGTTSNVNANQTVDVKIRSNGSSTVRATGIASVNSSGNWSTTVNCGTSVPYGAITADAIVSDKGGTTRTASRNGNYAARNGTISASVVTRNLATGQLSIVVSGSDLKPSQTVTAYVREDGTDISRTATVRSDGVLSTTYTWTVTPDGSGMPDLDFRVSAKDNNNVTVTESINNIQWNNTSSVAVTAASIASGTANLTITGSVTNLPAGYRVKYIATDSSNRQAVVNGTTPSAGSNGAVALSGTVNISGLGNGNITAKIEVVDQQGVTRSATKFTSWTGNARIDPGSPTLSYASNGTATMSMTFSHSGTWKAGSSWGVVINQFSSNTDSSATATQSVPFTVTNVSSTLIKVTWTLSTSAPHGSQYQPVVSRIDAAGNTKSQAAPSFTRTYLTFARAAYFTKNPVYVGKAANGESEFEFAIGNFLTWGNYTGMSPSVSYTSPSNRSNTLYATVRNTATSGFTKTFRFTISDVTVPGSYPIKVEWVTAQSTAGATKYLTKTLTHLKEEDAQLNLTDFTLVTRYSGGARPILIVDGFNARGKLVASSASGKTVSVTFVNDNPQMGEAVTYTDTTDSYGSFAVLNAGRSTVGVVPGTLINASATCNYNGTLLRSNIRGQVVPNDTGGLDPV